MNSIWIFLALGGLIVFLTFKSRAAAEPVPDLERGTAWLVAAMVLEMLFALIKAGNVTRPTNLLIADNWQNCLQWGCFVFVLLSLLGAVRAVGQGPEAADLVPRGDD